MINGMYMRIFNSKKQRLRGSVYEYEVVLLTGGESDFAGATAGAKPALQG